MYFDQLIRNGVMFSCAGLLLFIGYRFFSGMFSEGSQPVKLQKAVVPNPSSRNVASSADRPICMRNVNIFLVYVNGKQDLRPAIDIDGSEVHDSRRIEVRGNAHLLEAVSKMN